MTARPVWTKWVLILLCGMGLVSCRSSAPVIQSAGTVVGNEKVVLLPFQNMAWLHGENLSVRSPLTGKVFMTGPTTDDAARLLTDLLISALQQYTEFQTLRSQDAPAIRDALRSSGGPWASPVDVLAQTGRRINADLVIQGYVYRFKDRVGKDYSAESPASVAFALHFIDCADRGVVWSGSFDETQQALSDDLRLVGTFFRRGARWITAEEMAREAMNKMFREFTQP